ncbi:transposase [Infirmifilum sp. NZ]|uniref:transposase n=1 Tax=Infirmifilum sp. NZ TaxID=2926850 RepID=UPI0027A493B1|nr:transposase [Infirmifilum sp. NZ]UNQ73452.1 transposase [Infirmifilum sp. NZ]
MGRSDRARSLPYARNLQRLYVRLSSAVRQACRDLEKKYGDAFRRGPEKFSEELIEEASRLAGLPKGLLYYAGEWCKMLAEARRKSKRRSRYTPPPVPLLVRVVSNGERLHGKGDALAVLDVSRNELRVPSAGVAVRLKPSLTRAVLEDVERFPDFKLTLQLTSRGRLRLVARRVVKPAWWGGDGKLAVIAVDVNSSHGLYLLAFAFDGEVRLVVQRVFKLPNTMLLRLLAALMHSYSKVKCWSKAVERFRERRDVRGLQREGRGYAVEEALRLAEKLRAKINITPERAERIAGQALRKVRKLNDDWIRSVLRELRTLIRKLRDQGYTVVIVVDVPRAESLRGSQLQRTLLRVAERLENLAFYEGARWFKLDNNISGKRCPLCGREGVEVQRRYYKCKRCGLVYGRDWTAAFNATKLFLKVCKATKQLEALSQWLQSHPRALVHGSRSFPKQTERKAPAPVPAPAESRLAGAARGARRGCARGNAG